MKKEVVIKANKIKKTYNTDSVESKIIDNLNLEIYNGDFTIIMGPSGSGKSTLLYMLSGLDNVTSGDINFDNVKVTELKEKEMAEFRKEKIGFVFQEPNLLDDFDVLENITMPAYTNIKNKSVIKDRGISILKKLNIEKHKDKYPTQLSGGEKQRVAIARGLINNPEVLIADEPTGALNSKQTTAVLELLSKINKDGQSIVMVTHDIKSASYGNRILYLKNGNIIAEMNLKPYQKEEETEREEEIFTFLKRKGW